MTKILILEDDDFIRQQLAGILQEKGYSVVEAASVTITAANKPTCDIAVYWYAR